MHEDGAVDARGAQLARLVAAATASQVAPPASAARAAGHGAVAVAVGLDDRAQLGAAGQLAPQPRRVALDRAEVDPRDRAHAALIGLSRDATRRGSASTTSPAMTPSGRTRSPASRPAARVQAHAGAGGRERLHALRQQRADRRRRARRRCPRSPAPGAQPRLTPTRPSGRGDERVVALEHDDRAGRAAAASRAWRRRARLDCVAVDAEQPPELARVRRQDGRRRAARRALQRARVRVEAVGVEHAAAASRRAASSRANAARAVVAAEPRAERRARRRARPPRATASAPSATRRPSPSGSARVITSVQLASRRWAAASAGTSAVT